MSGRSDDKRYCDIIQEEGQEMGVGTGRLQPTPKEMLTATALTCTSPVGF